MAKSLDGSSPIKIGSALLLIAAIGPGVISFYVSSAVGDARATQMEKQIEYSIQAKDQMARDINEIKIQLGRIEERLPEKRR